MGSDSESYMQGWTAGYHNATLAERKRIIQIINKLTNKELAKLLTESINRK